MIFFGLAIAVLTRDVLMIMADSSFWSAYKIVPIIVMANIIFNLSAHINMGLLITKNTKYFMYINLSNGIFILFLNLFLIRKYGVYGAAFATLIAFIYKVSLTYYFSSKYYTIHFEFLRIGKILLATVIIYLGTMPIQFDSVYTTFLVKFSIILLFPAMLFASNFYTQVEKEKIEFFLWPMILSLKRIFVS
jgi:O-antigen/teichoic acid export membrane protein